MKVSPASVKEETERDRMVDGRKSRLGESAGERVQRENNLGEIIKAGLEKK